MGSQLSMTGNRASLRALVFALSFVAAAPLVARAEGADEDVLRNRPGEFVLNRPANLYARPSADAAIIRQLPANTAVNVVEVLDQWYEVHSTKGHEDGFIRRSYADPRGRGGAAAAHGRRFKVGMFKLTDPVVVRDQPSTSSQKITTLRAGAEVRVVDKDPSGLWYKIESESGNRPPGWIPTQAAKRVGGR